MRRLRLGKLDVWLAGGEDREGGGGGPALVMLHGFGAPGADLVPMWRQLEVARDVRFAFPEGPLILETGLPAEVSGRAWWMIDIAEIQQRVAQGRMAELASRVPEGLSEARSVLAEALDALEAECGVPSSRVVLGGFSQGSMLSCDFALNDERPLAGLVLFSSTLLCRDDWQRLAPKRKGLPVLQSHGRADPVLPFALAEQQRDLLLEAGLDVEFIAFNGGHGIAPSGTEALSRFVNQHLG